MHIDDVPWMLPSPDVNVLLASIMRQLSNMGGFYLDAVNGNPNDWLQDGYAATATKDKVNDQDLGTIQVARNENSTRAIIQSLRDKNKELEAALTNLRDEHSRLLESHRALQRALTDSQGPNVRMMQPETSIRDMAEQNRWLSVNYATQQLSYSHIQAENAKLRKQYHQCQQQYQQAESKHQQEIEDLQHRLKSKHGQPKPEKPGKGQQGTSSDNVTDTTPDQKSRPAKEALSNDSSTERHAGESTGKTPRKWLCSLCNKWYSRREHLRRHQRSVHMNHKPHECTICNRLFSRGDHLQNHVRRSHAGVDLQRELEEADLEYSDTDVIHEATEAV